VVPQDAENRAPELVKPVAEAKDQPARDAENRVTAAERLKLIGKAMLDHQGVYYAYPAGIAAKGGGLGLSWRVQLLLFMGKEEADLYSQFKLDEPWDGPTNKELIGKMPAVYASPGKQTEPGKTHLRSFVGEMAFLYGTPPKDGNVPVLLTPSIAGAPARGRPFLQISDGTSNTLAVAEAAEPVEWTKPDDLPCYGYRLPKTPDLPKVPKLGGVYAGGFHGLMADGKVVFFPADLPESDLRALITVNAGDNFSPQVMKVLYPNGIPKPGPVIPAKDGK
jgi:hypothetical protein